MAAFEAAAGEAGENEKVLVTGFEEVSDAYARMTITADTMFASFEAEGKPVSEDVIAFEESVDTIFNASDKAWTAYNADDEDIPQSANSSVRALYGRLLAAVQESYAYPILGDEIEKEDAMADFAEFDTIVTRVEETYPDMSYDGVNAQKTELQAAAEAVFASYEKDGVANAEDVAALESLVELMNDDVMKLFDTVSAEKPAEVESTPSEDGAVNTTA